MDRSIFPSGVLVDQVDLARTESTKAFHIVQRHQDTAVLGVVSGQVSINTLNLALVDVGAFTGYVSNGEYVESTGQIGLALADYANGAVNYVVAVYTETSTILKPHEINGLSYPTSANGSFRIRVLSSVEYNTLPDTDNNLANDALDRTLILALVTAQGVGVNLTQANIVNPTTFGNAISAVKTNNITGVSIYSVDRTTTPGIGLLNFTISGSIPYLQWKSPDPLDSYGSNQAISVSGIFELKSGLNKSLFVIISTPTLPGSTPVTDNVTITNIYTQTVPHETAFDAHHRSLIGSGVPTTVNPHGLTLEDIGVSAGVIEIHQEVMHSNGILRSSNSNLFRMTVNVAGVDSVDVIAPIVGDVFYINGKEHNLLATSNIAFGAGLPSYQSLYDIYVDEGTNGVASLEKRIRAAYVSVSSPAGMGAYVQLRNLDRRLAQTADTTVKIKYNDTTQKVYFDSTGVGTSYGIGVLIPFTPATGAPLRVFDSTDTYYIDLFINPSINGSGNFEQVITVYKLTVTTETIYQFDAVRLFIGSILYSDAINAALGNGFDISPLNGPNYPYSYRLIFGTLGPKDLRDDANALLGTVDRTAELSPAWYANRKIGLGQTYPGAMLDLVGGINDVDFNDGQLRLRSRLYKTHYWDILHDADDTGVFDNGIYITPFDTDGNVLNNFSLKIKPNINLGLSVSGDGYNAGGALFESNTNANEITIRGVNGALINDIASIKFQAGVSTTNVFSVGLAGTVSTHANDLRITRGTSNIECLTITTGGSFIIGPYTTTNAKAVINNQIADLWLRNTLGPNTGDILNLRVDNIGRAFIAFSNGFNGTPAVNCADLYIISQTTFRLNIGSGTGTEVFYSSNQNMGIFQYAAAPCVLNIGIPGQPTSVGINVGNPAAQLDVLGAGIFRLNDRDPASNAESVSRNAQNAVMASATFQFNGTGAPTLYDDHWNALSASRQGVGQYRITFDVALHVYDRVHVGFNNPNLLAYGFVEPLTGAYASIFVTNGAGVPADPSSINHCFVTIFGRPFTMP